MYTSVGDIMMINKLSEPTNMARRKYKMTNKYFISPNTRQSGEIADLRLKLWIEGITEGVIEGITEE